jgi:hypothetical protein
MIGYSSSERLSGTPHEFQRSANALTYLQFRTTFQRPDLKAFFEAIIGMTLGNSNDFGAYAMTHGDCFGIILTITATARSR